MSASYHYYSLEGYPCRVDPKAMRGEIYRAGKGFEPYSAFEIRFEGDLVTEKEFKELVVAAGRRKK